MLTELSIKNFKAWRDTGKIRLAPITVSPTTSTPIKPSSIEAQVALGEWAEKRVQELRVFTRLIRTGQSSETLLPKFSQLFSDVIDRLPDTTFKRLIEEAGGRLMTVPDLMVFIGDVKQLSGLTLSDYRKKYGRQAGVGRKRPETNIALLGRRPGTH